MKVIKNFIKSIIRKSRWLRKIIYKLYPVALPYKTSDLEVELIENENFYKKKMFKIPRKATYQGHSFEYLNSRILTKEERICELKQVFYKYCGYYLDIDNPKTFNQKIQWLKMYYKDPRMARCVDKAEFKNYIEEQLGEGYTVPLYGVWEKEGLIDFDALPDSFVLKSTLQSDGRHIIVVKDKSMYDMDYLKTVLSSWLIPRNSLRSSYCNAYNHLRTRILAEEMLEPEEGGIDDYKFYCYNGVCRHFLVCKDRGEKTKYINYDLDLNCIKLSPKSYITEEKFDRTPDFDKMLEIAEKLAMPFPFVRVDFYFVNGRIYVGELTFYPGGGYNTYYREWDTQLGQYMELPEANYFEDDLLIK